MIVRRPMVRQWEVDFREQGVRTGLVTHYDPRQGPALRNQDTVLLQLPSPLLCRLMRNRAACGDDNPISALAYVGIRQSNALITANDLSRYRGAYCGNGTRTVWRLKAKGQMDTGADKKYGEQPSQRPEADDVPTQSPSRVCPADLLDRHPARCYRFSLFHQPVSGQSTPPPVQSDVSSQQAVSEQYWAWQQGTVFLFSTQYPHVPGSGGPWLEAAGGRAAHTTFTATSPRMAAARESRLVIDWFLSPTRSSQKAFLPGRR